MKNRKLIYKGHIINVETGSTVLPNGHCMDVEIVQHPGGAAVVALNEAGSICLLKHYRCILNEWLWELPAGKIDHAEKPLKTARRELQEEAGLAAARWQNLGVIVSSPGVFTEKVHLFLATELRQVAPCAEASEVFELHWIPIAEAENMAQQGVILDSKTIVGILRALPKIKSENHPETQQIS